MSEGESVKVAVRVRPFNGREKDRNAVLIIQMIDKMTIIRTPLIPTPLFFFFFFFFFFF
jgi:kinesin family protein 1